MSTIRATFDRQLAGLRDDVLILGSMVDKAIDRSVEALKRRDRSEVAAHHLRRHEDQPEAVRDRGEVPAAAGHPAADGQRTCG